MMNEFERNFREAITGWLTRNNYADATEVLDVQEHIEQVECCSMCLYKKTEVEVEISYKDSKGRNGVHFADMNMRDLISQL